MQKIALQNIFCKHISAFLIGKYNDFFALKINNNLPYLYDF